MIELDRLAGEPLDVLVNGTLIAHGEVVMVNEKFGIQLTDVISPSERIKSWADDRCAMLKGVQAFLTGCPQTALRFWFGCCV